MQFKFQVMAFIFSQYHSMDFHSIFQRLLLISQIVLIPELINEFTVTV